MRYRVTNVVVWLDEPATALADRTAHKLGLTNSDLISLQVVRSVLDTRKKNSPRHVHTVEVELASELPAPRADVTLASPPPPPPAQVKRQPELRPVVVGMGPAGLFAALGLLERGVRCIVLERGKDVVERRRDVAKLMRDGSLLPESNMNFGEGGAGAYTDGKLSTRLNHPAVRTVIETFARYGAPPAILMEGKPHVGSDLLPLAVERFREDLVARGAEVRFGARVVDLLGEERVSGVVLSDGTTIDADRVVLAPGNSARELYETFAAHGRVAVEAKPFALGLRIEHPQALINELQYGAVTARRGTLPPADYKLAENLTSGGDARGVYSFCMCPGGVVVPTPTEPGYQCTNGMSNSRRNSRYANAGVVVSVSVDDFAREGCTGALAGLAFQRRFERAAYLLGGERYFAPAQRAADFLAGRPSKGTLTTSYRPGVANADLASLFPPWLTAALREALQTFNRRMPGYTSGEALLLGAETRTSAPVRIIRNERLQSVSLAGLYPAGEGCGYAGGIVSSGIDGLRVAEAIGEELST